MFSPRHHKGLQLLVTTPTPRSGCVFTVTCDGITKEQRGDTAYMQQGFIMSLSKRLTLGDQADENVWRQNQVLIYYITA